MKYEVYILLFLLAFAQGCEPESVSNRISEDFRPLFNGTDLDAWHASMHIRDTIQNNKLTLVNDQSAHYGYLLTEEQFENFHLKFDFRLPAISRVMLLYRYTILDSLKGKYNGYEISLKNTLDTQHPTGSIVNLARAIWPDSLNLNDWNHFELIADGDFMATYVNGQQVTMIHDRRSQKGSIGFKTIKSRLPNPIDLRNIKIRELPPKEITQPLLEDEFRNMYDKLPLRIFNGTNLDGWEIVGNGIWMAENGMITGKTNHDGFSFLKTKETYQDFYLKLKFKIREEHNSGVFIRQDPDSMAITLNTGLEINIYDHPGYDYLWPTGSVVSRARAFIGMVDYDDWNMLEVFAKGENICTYVNGIKASEYKVPSTFERPGHICLQVGPQIAGETKEGSEVSFKDITILTDSE